MPRPLPQLVLGFCLAAQCLAAQENPLIAITWGHRIYELKASLAAGAKINETDSCGWSPLMWAVYSEDMLMSEYLLRAGADPNLQSTAENRKCPKGTTALMIAAYMGLPDLAHSLVRGGAKADLRNAKGKTAVELATSQGYTDGFDCLGLKTAKDPELEKCLQVVEQGGDIQAFNARGMTPLMMAAYFQDLECLERFLKKGASVNAQATKEVDGLPSGATPLIIASYYGADRIVSALVREGADTSLKDAKGRTALSYAKDGGYASVCGLLGEGQAEKPLEVYYPNLTITVFTSEPTVKQHFQDVVEECGARMEAVIHHEGQFQVVPASGENLPSPRLLVKVDLNDIYVASGAARFFLGPVAGRSHIQAKVQLIDAVTNRLLKERILDSQSSVMLSSVSLGRHDNSLPGDAANLIHQYLTSVNQQPKAGGVPPLAAALSH